MTLSATSLQKLPQTKTFRYRAKCVVYLATYKKNGSGRSGHVCIYPLLTCTDQIYNPICSLCAMMWQLASTHGSSMVCTYLLTICCHHRQSKQHPTNRADSFFLAGIIKARIWKEFSIIELPNPLKSVRHWKLLKRQTSRVSYTT